MIVGNILHKGPNAQNTRLVAYGMEGIKHQRNALYVINNTLVYENHRPSSFFVRVEGTPAGFAPVIRNNLCIGAIPLTNSAHAETAGNLLFKTAAEAGVVDAAKYDFHLRAGSACIDRGVAPGKAGDFDLTPVFQYVHPCKKERRPAIGPLDVGAYEFAPSR